MAKVVSASEVSSSVEPIESLPDGRYNLIISADNAAGLKKMGVVDLEHDDALVLSIALHSELVVGNVDIISTYGNESTDRTFNATETLLNNSNSGSQINHHKGAEKPGEVSDGAQAMFERIKDSQGKVELLALGALTDIATVLKMINRDPQREQLSEKLRIIAMIPESDLSPDSPQLSFNSYKDPIALKETLQLVDELKVNFVAGWEGLETVALPLSTMIEMRQSEYSEIRGIAESLMRWNAVTALKYQIGEIIPPLRRIVGIPGDSERGGKFCPADTAAILYLSNPELFDTKIMSGKSYVNLTRIKDKEAFLKKLREILLGN